MFTVEEIAIICHDATRSYQALVGDLVNPPWEELDYGMKESIKHGVKVAQEDVGNGPDELHRQWCLVRESQGWVYGPTKDFDKKEHPNLVPWSELDPKQQVKDVLFRNIVRALFDDPTKEQQQ